MRWWWGWWRRAVHIEGGERWHIRPRNGSYPAPPASRWRRGMELERTGRICDAPEAASAREAWWAAARWLRRPLPWHHNGGDAYAGAGGKVGVADEVEGGDEVDSICSLAVDLFPLVEKVRVALEPAASNSSKSAMSFWNSSLIF